MTPDRLESCLGPAVTAAAARAEKARALIGLLESGRYPAARLVAVRETERTTSVVIDVHAEIGQQPRHDIRPTERVAALFAWDDAIAPEVLALRSDFPRDVPHINLRPRDQPANLCLTDQPYAEARRQWTPARFLEAIRRWLSDTARGALHRDDQPLEPFLADHAGHLIIPHEVPANVAAAPARLYGAQTWGPQHQAGYRPVYRLTAEPPGEGAPPPQIAAMVLQAAPGPHGAIRHTPATLAELHDLLAAERPGCDLLGALKTHLKAWRVVPALLDAHPLILLQLPLSRQAGGAVEREETWAFLLDKTIRQAGAVLDLWDVSESGLGLVLAPREDRRGADIRVELLNPHQTLTREDAQGFNRVDEPLRGKVCAIGAGALGSAVVLNLVREGCELDTIVDHDIVLPHNLARSAYRTPTLGGPKALALAMMARTILDEPAGPTGLVADVLVPEDQAPVLEERLRRADHILDLSASVAVARHLACDCAAPARRLSVFLNPSGTDLVLLAESADRAIRLDHLEMQYYWALATREPLQTHLTPVDRVRYAHSCRDLSARLPNAFIATLAGLATTAIRRAATRAEAQATIWQLDAGQLTVQRTEVTPGPVRAIALGEWTLFMSDDLLRALAARRAAKLPNETGGALIGSCDLQRRHLHLVGDLLAPPDSQEWPTHYIRGSRGLRRQVTAVQNRTAGMLTYIGEWHAHPKHASPRPSADDEQVHAWIDAHLGVEGLPAVMVIVSDDQTYVRAGPCSALIDLPRP